MLHGESPKRIQWLKDFMAQAPPFDELQPLGDDQGRFLLARAGEYYLLYCLDRGRRRVELAGDRPYKVDLVDPWEMTVMPLGTAQPGEFTVASAKSDLAYRFTPYAPGEKLRPGGQDLSVAHRGRAAADRDVSAATRRQRQPGISATAPRPRDNPATHTFERPGLYTVTLRVTDRDGGSAVDFVQIAVDRSVG